MQHFGIRELYRPENVPIELDIVAVHGLQGDALKTWTSKSKKEICWLNNPNFLPRYLPQARVLSWGYNANILALKGKSTSQDRILQHAQSLVAQLSADRELEDATERPIIFLCHSLGGIIVKRALAYSAARTASKISFLHSIYTCAYGILFFGTPHHGSSKASLLSTVRKLASITIPTLSIETNLLTALEEGSETLQDISDQFCPLMSRFRIFFFWEQEKTDLVVLRKKDYVVSEASAAPIVDNTERCGIAADHSSMCKFDSTDNQGFRNVIAALKRYARDAPPLIAQRRRRERESLQQQRSDEAMENMGFCYLPRSALTVGGMNTAQESTAEAKEAITSLHTPAILPATDACSALSDGKSIAFDEHETGVYQHRPPGNDLRASYQSSKKTEAFQR